MRFVSNINKTNKIIICFLNKKIYLFPQEINIKIIKKLIGSQREFNCNHHLSFTNERIRHRIQNNKIFLILQNIIYPGKIFVT